MCHMRRRIHVSLCTCWREGYDGLMVSDGFRVICSMICVCKYWSEDATDGGSLSLSLSHPPHTHTHMPSL
jgi:hypothetical protein